MAWLIPTLLTTTAALTGSGPADAESTTDVAALVAEVRATEVAFAKTMADRDHDRFVTFLAEEAIFIGGDGSLRGRAAIAAGWKRFYEGEDAPFSWEPTTVEVLASGTLAFSTGPVRAASGASLGSFNSIWRRQADGTWRIVFDRGCPPCPDP